MRVVTLGLAVVALLTTSCDRLEGASTGPGGKAQGRYSGIGTFEADRLWQEQADGPAPADPKTARLSDDQQIIVVIDTQSGEVRQCGNHSGHCVAMDPWKAGQRVTNTPSKLAKHAANLDAEAAAEPAAK